MDTPGSDPTRRHTDDLEAALTRWVAAGAIDGEQAERIRRLEAPASPQDSPTVLPLPASRVPLLAEIIGYAGGVLALGALVTILGSNWGSLTSPARIAILGTTTVILWLAGLGLDGQHQPAIRRMGSVLWAASVAAFAGTGVVLFMDVVDLGDDPAASAAFGISLMYSAVLWYFRRTAFQHLATFIAIVATETAMLGLPQDEPTELVYGMTFWVTGVVWILFTWAGRLDPPPLARLLGVGAALLGSQMVVVDETGFGILLGIFTALGVTAHGLLQRNTDLVALAGIGLLIFLPQAAVHWIGSSMGAAMALFVGGLTIVGIAVTIARMRSEQ